MKLLKYLLSTIFLILYVVFGFALALIIAVIEFIKSIPHTWKGLTIEGRLKDLEYLSKEDMTKVLKETMKEADKSQKAEKPDYSPDKVGIYYGGKIGTD